MTEDTSKLRLQGEGRIRRGVPDGERLTDLLTVYFGFGIFTTNAAISLPGRTGPGPSFPAASSMTGR